MHRLSLLLSFGLLFSACTENFLSFSIATRPALPLSSHPPEGMVLVPAGDFIMGSELDQAEADERPVHTVYLDDYFIDVTEVTTAAYTECVNAGICSAPQSGGDYHWGRSEMQQHGINGVTWHQANAYCQWLDKQLPTEAQWEKAARGTDARIYPWGDEEANCSYAIMADSEWGCGTRESFPVGSRPTGASPYGVQDMSGNLWEWVYDIHTEDYYAQSPASNPTGPEFGEQRVFRGGCFDNQPHNMRSTVRFEDPPDVSYRYLGFRCAKPLNTQQQLPLVGSDGDAP